MLKPIITAVVVTAVTITSAAFAQGTGTRYENVPFKVNVDATVTAVQGDSIVSINVTENVQKNLRLPVEVSGTTSVQAYGWGGGGMNAPVVTGSRGNITLRLPAQPYSNAEVVLYSVSGKRVLRGKADASKAASGISRRNVAAGVYMLSVKGLDGSAFTTRLTHSGGNMNINIAFGGEPVSHTPARQLGKQAADGDWDWKWKITVSAVFTDEKVYDDSTYTIDLQYLLGLGYNILPTQNITLKRIPLPPPVITPFTDERDGKIYNKVRIGTQTWMAENLNYSEDDEGNVFGVCYENETDNCAKYGRLYNWATAMDGSRSSSLRPSGVQGVCPAGWHLPSDAEWKTLTDAVGGASTAGTMLKSSTDWNSYSGVPVGTDEYGFSALPGGYGYSVGSFHNVGINGYWWSTMEYSAYYAWYRYMRGDGYENVFRGEIDKYYLYSVRCVED